MDSKSGSELVDSEMEELKRGKIYTGIEFNKLTKGKAFAKCVPNRLCSRFDDTFRYKNNSKLHINGPFYPDTNCSTNGIYFFDIENLPQFTDFGEYLVIVKVPDDEWTLVSVGDYKFKCNNLYFEQIIKMIDHPILTNQDLVERLVIKDWTFLQFIKNQTPRLCEIAFDQNVLSLEFIQHQTEKMCNIAIFDDTKYKEYITSHSGEIKEIERTIRNFRAFKFILDKFKTYDMCMLVMSNPETSTYLDLVPKEFQDVKLNWTSLVKSNSRSYNKINNPTYEMALAAVRMNCWLISDIDPKFQTDELCKTALYINGSTIQYIVNPTDEMNKIAVSYRWTNIAFVKNKTKEICDIAEAQSPEAKNYF